MSRPKLEDRMSVAPKILIQKMWDVTVVDFQEARLLEAHQIEAAAPEPQEDSLADHLADPDPFPAADGQRVAL